MNFSIAQGRKQLNKRIFITNGMARCGKDTFAKFLNEITPTMKYSSIDKVKDIARLCGWEGGKTERDRKFLSDLKMLISEYSDLPFLATKEKIDATEAEWQSLVKDYKNQELKKVFFLISDYPLFSLSDMSFLSQAIKSCRTENIFADMKQVSFIASPEEILLRNPEVVIHGYSTTEPNDKERSQEAAIKLFEKVGLELSTEQLVTVDADILYRPTLRFIKALPQICEAIHHTKATAAD